ncbi:hypothetical protein L204_101769 [Cryptococcus depauperatus]
MSSDKSQSMGEIPDGCVFSFDDEPGEEPSDREPGAGSRYDPSLFATGGDGTSHVKRRCDELFKIRGQESDTSVSPHRAKEEWFLRKVLSRGNRPEASRPSFGPSSMGGSSKVDSRPGLHRSGRVYNLQSMGK